MFIFEFKMHNHADKTNDQNHLEFTAELGSTCPWYLGFPYEKGRYRYLIICWKRRKVKWIREGGLVEQEIKAICLFSITAENSP